MTKNKKQLSKKSLEAFETFNQAAQNWGWQRDCGVGSSVDQAEQSFTEAKQALLKRIQFLENQVLSLKNNT